eukprot:1474585-Ditylum_brightwellii.AAC.1
MYLEVAEGNVLPVCQLEECMAFWEFRERLSEQMCGYRLLNKLYMGDKNMRVCVQQHKVRREKGAGLRLMMIGTRSPQRR